MAAKFVLTATDASKFHFSLKAGNGEVILTSQTYATKDAATGGIDSIKANAGTDGRYDRRTSSAKEPYFVLTAANGQVIGTSQMYSSASAMEKGIDSVKANAPGATVEDTTKA